MRQIIVETLHDLAETFRKRVGAYQKRVLLITETFQNPKATRLNISETVHDLLERLENV